MRRLIVSLMLIVGLILTLSCAKGDTREVPVEKEVVKEVIKEVPVEKVVEREVVREALPSVPAPPGMPGELTLAGQSWATERMIVRSGNMHLKVKNVAEALNRIKEIAEWWVAMWFPLAYMAGRRRKPLPFLFGFRLRNTMTPQNPCGDYQWKCFGKAPKLKM